MTYKIKSAFDIIRAENSLKANTLLHLQDEIQKRNEKRYATAIRFAAVFASLAVILLSGMLYTVPSAYVDVDVNPSVGLSLNRFDRVVGIHAYNEDGENVVSGLSLKHKSYMDALDILLVAMEQKGYTTNNGLVSVTLQTENTGKEKALLSHISSIMDAHRGAVNIDVFPVDASTRNEAHGHNLTPAKYLAIRELMEVDPTASIDNCRGYTISEIKQHTHNCRMQTNGPGHHMNGNGHRRHHGG